MVKVYTREKLIEQVEKGISFDYLLFYGHKESPDGEITDSCFSQWFPASFEVDGQVFPTTEHYMMAKKAILFSDQEMLENILACKTPRAAKAFGRSVNNFNPAVWEKQRSRIVVEANLAKFSQNQGMKDFLLASAPKILVEASPRDRIWGIGMGKGNPDALAPCKWRGKNLLGFALFEICYESTEQKSCALQEAEAKNQSCGLQSVTNHQGDENGCKTAVLIIVAKIS